MMNMHSKYDNLHKNEIIYVLTCINNKIISSINYMLVGHIEAQVGYTKVLAKTLRVVGKALEALARASIT